MNNSELKDELEKLHSASFGWALSCCRGDRTEAEDVLQSVYLKILEGKALYRAESSLKTWLFAVIRKTSVSEHRRGLIRKLRISESANRIDNERDTRASQDLELERSELNLRFRSALNSLPSRQRQALHLVFYENLTLQEVAEVMSVSVGSVRQHYERGKKRLRETFKRTENDYANNWRGTQFTDAVL